MAKTTNEAISSVSITADHLQPFLHFLQLPALQKISTTYKLALYCSGSSMKWIWTEPLTSWSGNVYSTTPRFTRHLFIFVKCILHNLLLLHESEELLCLDGTLLTKNKSPSAHYWSLSLEGVSTKFIQFVHSLCECWSLGWVLLPGQFHNIIDVLGTAIGSLHPVSSLDVHHYIGQWLKRTAKNSARQPYTVTPMHVSIRANLATKRVH